jgi:hypothetical protein
MWALGVKTTIMAIESSKRLTSMVNEKLPDESRWQATRIILSFAPVQPVGIVFSPREPPTQTAHSFVSMGSYLTRMMTAVTGSTVSWLRFLRQISSTPFGCDCGGENEDLTRSWLRGQRRPHPCVVMLKLRVKRSVMMAITTIAIRV